jgi:son of sevenless-like protein
VRRKLTATTTYIAPSSILPKSGEPLRLLDIDPTELARQLSVLESNQYNAITPIECLARAWDKTSDNDGIKATITTTNKIGSWVVGLVLENQDLYLRKAIIKHFIVVAEVSCVSPSWLYLAPS